MGNRSFAGSCVGIDYTSSVDKGCAPLVVKFSAKGFPSGSTFEWDFGNGFVKATDTTNKIFITPKIYAVKMVVTQTDGTKCTVSHNIEVYATPKPRIVTTPSSLSCFGTKTFTLYDSTIGSVKSEWVIDGQAYTTSSVIAKFKTNGYKSVALKVTNNLGCTGLLNEPKFINITDSGGIDFCGNMVQNPGSGTQVKFIPYIYTGNRAVVKYMWTFPGGTPAKDSTLSPPSVSYPNGSGKYDATFSFTTADGCVYTKTLKEIVLPFFTVVKDSGCLKEKLLLKNLANSGGKTQFGWLLDGGEYKTGSNNTDTVQFQTTGIKDVQMIFKTNSSSGCLNFVKKEKAIKIFGPIARFEAKSKYLCSIKDTLQLKSTSDTFGNTKLTYKWEIFDTLNNHVPGSPFNTKSNNYLNTFLKSNGAFTVRLTIIGDKGCQDTVRKIKYIVVRQPVGDIKVDTPMRCIGKDIVLEPIVVPAEDKDNPYKYLWILENQDSLAIVNNVAIKKAKFTPNYAGRYNVNLVIQSGVNCVDTVRRPLLITVRGVEGKAKYVGPLDGCPSATNIGRVYFTFFKKYPDTITNVLRYKWIPKGNSVSMTSTTDTFSDVSTPSNGCYTFALNVMDTFGCISDFSAGGGCFGVGPDFQIAKHKCLGEKVKINNSSVGNPQKYKWIVFPANAGAFSPSDTIAAPDFTYLRNDTAVKVSLIITKTDKNGVTCSAQHDTLMTGFKFGQFSFKSSVKSAYCAPVLVNFENNSTYAGGFTWYFGDGDSVVSNSKTIVHVYQKNNPSGFLVRIKGYDSAGCTREEYLRDTLKILGPAPKFTISADRACDSLYVNFIDKSQTVKSFIMDYDDGSPQDTVSIKPHWYRLQNGKDSMRFIPTMVALDDKNCKNFHTDTIFLFKSPKAKFSVDKNKGCPPLLVNFVNSSDKYGKLFQWDFDGDGITDDTAKNPSFIYTKSGNFKAKLTVIGKGGCKDSFFLSGGIEIDPIPTADYSISKSTLCVSEKVSFTMGSTNAFKYVFDYGDGSKPDTDTVFDRIYGLRPGEDSSNYTTQLFVYNKLGCKDSMSKSITVYKKAIAKFSVDTTKGCEPLTVKYSLTPSVFASKTYWDNDLDGSEDDTGITFSKTLPYGKYSARVISISPYGCNDTSTVIDLISVQSIPTAYFQVNDSSVCADVGVDFQDLSSGNKSGIIRYQWKFTTRTNDTSDIANPTFVYSFPGIYKPSLRITNAEGCSDSYDSLEIEIKDTTNLTLPEIKFISVLDSNSIVIYFKKDSGVLSTNIIRDRMVILAGNTFMTIDSSYLDAQVGLTTYNEPISYVIQKINACGRLSKTSLKHTSVRLKTGVVGNSDITLEWTGYRGMPVDSYIIMRSIDGNPFIKIGSTPPNLFTYKDIKLCDKNYLYYVVAVYGMDGYLSNSNKVGAKPNYIKQDVPLRLDFVTVLDSALLIHWQSAFITNIDKYTLDRYDTINGWIKGYYEGLATSFTDRNVSVSQRNYLYKVSVKDVCGNINPESNIGKNIVLNLSVVNDDYYLQWNSYLEWKEGIARYVVQYQNSNGEFVFYKNIFNGDSELVIQEALPGLFGSTCFRVMAISRAGDSSISNTQCEMLASRMFVPNSFTPNSDGLNDVWQPMMLSINPFKGNEFFEYTVRVYDRWGTRVFETYSPIQGWDGTVNGKLAKEGNVFIYVIKAKGMDGRNYNLKGNITLLR